MEILFFWKRQSQDLYKRQIVTDDNLSLAIGKKGTNIKLASRLTKYKIEVTTLSKINEQGNKDHD